MSKFINADALYDELVDIEHYVDEISEDSVLKRDDVLSVVYDAPAANVRENIKGEWQRHYSRLNVFADLFWHCSICGHKSREENTNIYYNFCPNCGADMREVSDDIHNSR